MCHLCEDGLWLSPTCGWDLGFCCDSPGFFVFYSGFVGLGLFSRKDLLVFLRICYMPSTTQLVNTVALVW